MTYFWINTGFVLQGTDLTPVLITEILWKRDWSEYPLEQIVKGFRHLKYSVSSCKKQKKHDDSKENSKPQLKYKGSDTVHYLTPNNQCALAWQHYMSFWGFAHKTHTTILNNNFTCSQG